jgi:hypothetical protein
MTGRRKGPRSFADVSADILAAPAKNRSHEAPPVCTAMDAATTGPRFDVDDEDREYARRSFREYANRARHWLDRGRPDLARQRYHAMLLMVELYQGRPR